MSGERMPAPGAAVLERRTAEILRIQDRKEAERALNDFCTRILIPGALIGLGPAGADCYDRISRHIESLPRAALAKAEGRP